MPKQVFTLTYADEQEERNIKWFRKSGLRDYFKKLNDRRCGCALEESPLPTPMESIRAFFIRFTCKADERK